jgi:hypothetical protein
MNKVEIIASADGLTISAEGLGFGARGQEICASVDDVDLGVECRKFVIFVLAYMSEGQEINPGETMGYGYWIVKAVADDNGRTCFWERSPDGSDYIPGVSNTLRYWRDQNRVCEAASSLFVPPNAEQMVVISDGVLEGDVVQGVRYPSPNHMSGWWITTDRYDGNVASLRTVHAYHVTSKRPDLAMFLGLAFGYRFYSDNDEVRFDPKVVNGAVR